MFRIVIFKNVYSSKNKQSSNYFLRNLIKKHKIRCERYLHQILQEIGIYSVTKIYINKGPSCDRKSIPRKEKLGINN